MTDPDPVKFNAISVSTFELISTYIEILLEDEHTIVVHEPTKYENILKKLNLNNKLENIYESQIVALTFDKISDALFVFDLLCKEKGPYCLLYCNGKYLTDSIEEDTN